MGSTLYMKQQLLTFATTEPQQLSSSGGGLSWSRLTWPIQSGSPESSLFPSGLNLLLLLHNTLVPCGDSKEFSNSNSSEGSWNFTLAPSVILSCKVIAILYTKYLLVLLRCMCSIFAHVILSRYLSDTILGRLNYFDEVKSLLSFLIVGSFACIQLLPYLLFIHWTPHTNGAQNIHILGWYCYPIFFNEEF